jgi:hypothetical protein
MPQGGGGWLQALSGIAGGGANDLQRMGGNYLQKYMQANPEQQALDYALPSILQQLSGGVSDQIQPLRDIATTNLNDSLAQMRSSVPNRMSSAALWQEGATRQRSAQDFNLLAQQAMEQARSRQLQASQTLGLLSGQAGMGGFNRAMGASQVGNQQQGQQMQALLALLAPMMGATYGGPMTQGTSGFQDLMSLVQTIGPLIAAPATGGASLGAFALPSGSGYNRGGG